VQVRAVTFSSYFSIAKQVGIDGPRLLTEAGIAMSDLEDSEARLPANAAVRLLQRSAELSACDSFGLRMAQARSFASLGPVSLLLEHLATVGDVVEAMIFFRRMLADIVLVALEKADDVAMITFDLVPPYGSPQATDLTVGLGFMTLAGASGGRWSSESVHFTHSRPSDTAPFEAFFAAPVQFNSSFNGFTCQTSSLDTALPLANDLMAQNAARLLGSQPMQEERTLADEVTQAIAQLLPKGRATLECVTANLGLNSRTLQRGLKAEDQAFGRLLNDARRDLARQHLAGSRMPITEIAELLGYSTPASFARWFHAEFDVTPREWRSAQWQISNSPPPIWKI